MKYNKIQWFLVLGIIFIQACDNYLDESPSKQKNIELKTVGHLDALLAGMTTYTSNSTLALSSDLTEVPVDLYRAAGGKQFYWPDMLYYFWSIDELADQTSTGVWSNIFSRIFTANTVLENVSKVTGDEYLKNDLKAEAHFIRAFSNWELVNTYCLPYSEENKNELGIPKKNSTDFEQSLVRMNLEDSYEYIEEDLKEALKTKNDNLNRKWRVSLPVVNAFMARYYLFRNNYDEALKYAELALKANTDLVDYNTEMEYGTSINTANGQLEVPCLWSTTDGAIKLEWKEFYYQFFLSYGDVWYSPSTKFLNLFDKEHDLRYKYFIIEHFSWYFRILDQDYPGYSYFRSNIPSGPTVQEMILTKAECLARKGDHKGAMETVNILRAKRMVPGTHVNLTANSKEEAILKILDERARELTYAMRWFDIRRYNNNETDIDDVVMTRYFYPHSATDVETDKEPIEYRMELKDRRFAVPINNDEIRMSHGQIQQNRYK